MKSHPQSLTPILFFLIGILVTGLACSLPLVSQRPSPTQLAAVTVSVEAASPTPLPVPRMATPKPTAEAQSGSFNAVDGLPAMAMNGLWAAPDGSMWVTGSQGVYRFEGQAWSKLSSQPVALFLGGDTAGRVWAVFGSKGGRIGAYKDGQWSQFDQKEGWNPLPEPVYLSPGPTENLVTDAQGRLWWASGASELRRFDPEDGTWTSLSAQDLGLPALQPGAQGYFMTGAVSLRSKKVWTGLCAGEGEAYLPVGIGSFDGKSWSTLGAVKENCVLTTKISPDSDIWAGGFDSVWQYCQACNTWKQISLPAYDRKQLVSSIDFDSSGDLWVEAIRFGGASAFGSVVRYHYFVKDAVWYQNYEAAPYDRTALAFSKKTGPFLAAGGALYNLAGNHTQKVRDLEPAPSGYRLQVDSSGRLWVERAGDAKGGLWIYQP